MSGEPLGLSEPVDVIPPISYNEFKSRPIEDIIPGTVVKGVSPARLFASQDDTDPIKIGRKAGLPFDTVLDPLPAYVHQIEIEGRPPQRVLVLGDHHHTALNEWEAGNKVDIQIVGILPPGKRITAFSVLRQRSGSPFRD